MAVTKRTRFEILRRDSHTCQYCGEVAPNVVLHIDHVIPVALGGGDKPDNLVTACKDCNSGKTSIAPDSPLVASIGAEAAAYVLGMQDKMTRFRADIESLDDYIYEFDCIWEAWKTPNGEHVPLPAGYQMTLFRWMQMGIPSAVYALAIPGAMGKSNRDRYLKDEGVFAYMCGIVWNMINAREIDYTVTTETVAVYTEREMGEIGGHHYSEGKAAGFRLAQKGVTVE